ncbi:MAG: helix-turn-helix domain-containing protein [Nitrososphaerota archaeon]
MASPRVRTNPQKPSPTKPRQKSNIIERVERYEFIEGYGEIIRKAREKLGMTREELGALIQDKASVIKKIENEELKPTIEQAKKLEKTLKVKILVEVSEEVEELFKPPKTKPTGVTLGDLMRSQEKER